MPQVNQMLARSDDELRLFHQMDKDWWAGARRTSRLMRLEEVPKWVLEPKGSEKESEVGFLS
jgi:hypothetical protein